MQFLCNSIEMALLKKEVETKQNNMGKTVI